VVDVWRKAAIPGLLRFSLLQRDSIDEVVEEPVLNHDHQDRNADLYSVRDLFIAQYIRAQIADRLIDRSDQIAVEGVQETGDKTDHQQIPTSA